MKIISIDTESSSSEKGFATRYLVLDNLPNVQWTKLFMHNHQSSMDLNKREVSITGNNIKVDCCMDEIQHQINSLNAICKKTDEQLIAAIEKSQREEQERAKEIQEKRKFAKEEFGKLKF